MTATRGRLHSSKRIPRVNHSSGTSRAQLTLGIPEFTSKNAPSLSRVKVMEATDEFESSRTAYESVGQPMGAAYNGGRSGTRIPSRSSPEARAADYTNLPINGGP